MKTKLVFQAGDISAAPEAAVGSSYGGTETEAGAHGVTMVCYKVDSEFAYYRITTRPTQLPTFMPYWLSNEPDAQVTFVDRQYTEVKGPLTGFMIVVEVEPATV